MPIDQKVEIVYLYGSEGRSSEIDAWLYAKPTRTLVILEEDIGKVLFSLADDPQVQVRLLSDNIFEELASEFPTNQIHFAPSKQPKFRSISLEIRRRTILWQASLAEALHSHLFYRNVLSNIRQLPHSFFINRWKDIFKGIPAIICGAGPSLKEAISALKSVDNRALIFGCGSALSSLAHFGVEPHFGVAVDPNPREYEALLRCKGSKFPLLYAGRLFPKVLELFEGPIGYIRSGTGGACESYFEEVLGLDAPHIGLDLGREALSVTTLAVSTAKFLGCSPILLAGVDLAYTDKKNYAPGVPAAAPSEEPLLRRKNRQGKWISTTVKWLMERDTLVAYGRTHPLFTITKEGLPHVPHIPLQDVLSKRHALQETIHKTILLTALCCSPKFTALLESLIRCQSLVKQIIASKGRGKAVVLQMDLEEELAYRVLLQSILPAFSRAFRTSKELEKWVYLKKCIASIYSVMSEY